MSSSQLRLDRQPAQQPHQRTQAGAGFGLVRPRALAAGLRLPDDAEFVRWFDLMGVQRHLKVLGIFARLNYRDGKAQYLDDMPRVHVETAIGQFEGTRGLLTSVLEEELERSPGSRELVEPARAAALGRGSDSVAIADASDTAAILSPPEARIGHPSPRVVCASRCFLAG